MGPVTLYGCALPHHVADLPVMIGPMAIIGITSIFGAEQVAIWVFAALGVIGVIFSKPLLTLCQRRFIQRKYALCEGFRKKE